MTTGFASLITNLRHSCLICCQHDNTERKQIIVLLGTPKAIAES